MMPPLEPLDPPEGNIVPYPMEILTLGGNRWLTQDARIITEPFGVPCDVFDNGVASTRAYWDGRAAKAGYTLAELLGE